MLWEVARHPSSIPGTGPATELEPRPGVPGSPAGWTPPQDMRATQLVQAVCRLGSWVGASVQEHGLFISVIVRRLAQS